MFGDMRKALAAPENADVLRMPLELLKPYANEHPRSYPVQIMAGLALRKAGQLDEAMQAFERAAALIPTARGADSPHAQMAAIAMDKKDVARAITELTAIVATDFDNIEARAAARHAAAADQRQHRTPAGAEKLRPVYERIAAIDPFDAEAHATLGRLAMQRNEPSRRCVSSGR
jgi:tetratricopeptide (TPR) repeat protein